MPDVNLESFRVRLDLRLPLLESDDGTDDAGEEGSQQCVDGEEAGSEGGRTLGRGWVQSWS